MRSWLRADLKDSARFERGLDVACGTMDTRRYFLTKEYIGIDSHEPSLREGLRRHPDVNGYLGSIEELSETGGFVVCIQAIGVNTYFKPQNSVQAIQKLIDAVEPKGTLIVNIGPGSSQYEGDVDAMLNSAFASVTKRRYGRMNGILPKHLALLAMHAMRVVPVLRLSPNRHVYYSCRDRLSDA